METSIGMDISIGMETSIIKFVNATRVHWFIDSLRAAQVGIGQLMLTIFGSLVGNKLIACSDMLLLLDGLVGEWRKILLDSALQFIIFFVIFYLDVLHVEEVLLTSPARLRLRAIAALINHFIRGLLGSVRCQVRCGVHRLITRLATRLCFCFILTCTLTALLALALVVDSQEWSEATFHLVVFHAILQLYF